MAQPRKGRRVFVQSALTLPAFVDVTTLAGGGAGSVDGSCVTTRERPKSQIFNEQSSLSRTFAGWEKRSRGHAGETATTTGERQKTGCRSRCHFRVSPAAFRQQRCGGENRENTEKKLVAESTYTRQNFAHHPLHALCLPIVTVGAAAAAAARLNTSHTRQPPDADAGGAGTLFSATGRGDGTAATLQTTSARDTPPAPRYVGARENYNPRTHVVLLCGLRIMRCTP